MKKIGFLWTMAFLAILCFGLIGCDDGNDKAVVPPGEPAYVNPALTEYLNALPPPIKQSI